MELDATPPLPIAIKRVIGKIIVVTNKGSKIVICARLLNVITQTKTEIAAAIEFAKYPSMGSNAVVRTNRMINAPHMPTIRIITFLL